VEGEPGHWVRCHLWGQAEELKKKSVKPETWMNKGDLTFG
jgi:hypothetical protein